MEEYKHFKTSTKSFSSRLTHQHRDTALGSVYTEKDAMLPTNTQEDLNITKGVHESRQTRQEYISGSSNKVTSTQIREDNNQTGRKKMTGVSKQISIIILSQNVLSPLSTNTHKDTKSN